MTAEEEIQLAPGARIFVRDEEWLVRNVTRTEHDGFQIKAVGVSEFVQDEEATFFTALDEVQLIRPEDTELVADPTPRFRRSRLFLEAILRKTPLPQSERRLAVVDRFLLDPLTYQQRPAELALRGLRPRILLADVVGLGKTLEVGLILAELIRRGRGDRILVVTPQHVLEQFQHEMWTRFSIPLIRLDSVGIQRIQQRIPAGRNPFTYYKRVIVSIDTLKNPGQYRHHLERIHWDAVVIDESHNLIGSKNRSLRNQLAHILAPRTDALLLASATPHNGDKESFAELISLLDPAAIVDPKQYSAKDIEHLYIRRTKNSPEVRDQLGDAWAERGPSIPVRCAATPAEEKIFTELAQVWLPGAERAEGPLVGVDRLFPYALLKAFLSSHHALAETVTNRLKTLASRQGSSGGAEAAVLDRERMALERLRELAEGMTDDDSAKLAALIEQLRQIGVGPHSETRVVVFSERVATLKWLQKVVPPRLGFTGKAAQDAVRVMHGGISDTEQQRIVEEFSLAASKVRILFTGDIASEGVNLHRQCHHLIHYDLPWSLIRIEQRNGRIDRYGQRRPPEFRALILTSQVPGAKDDTTVAEKLLAREAAAHASLGTAEAVTGEYRADREERRLIQDLLAGKSVEESLATGPDPAEDVLAALLAGVGVQPQQPEPERVELPTLFASTEEFVDEALREVYGSPEDALQLRREDGVVIFTPPSDLRHRLSVLPASYLVEQRANERLRVTFDRRLAQERLDRARESDKTIWPDVSYLSDLHPVVEWLVDKVLVRLGRQQAPVIKANVDGPVFLVQGIYSNAFGRPTIVKWMAVRGLPHAEDVDDRMSEVLVQAGVGPDLINPGPPTDLAALQRLVPAAIEAARKHLERERERWDAAVVEPLRVYQERLERWEQLSLSPELAPAHRGRREREVRATVDEQRRLVKNLETSGEPLLRLLAVLEGAS
ncbi:Helicase domain-containing protein [Carbonactinospora thermoautotrophica]|uniref:Helicase domain-containing protein n=1 Tax=Carbonactinospora thermoautotrophica TaxID=1469144 RepID=A0A132MTB5_9ACTN|nr:helicase-related protein [Carbonactinospora thermoautotrophica]KWX01083.1 Helicase domain-containing protein [Carbonactinospora thermoautotrophica]